MSKITIKLPEKPKDLQYEDFIAAHFQVSGYYVERSIIDRGKAEILELDIIITDYDGDVPSLSLVEIKSGNWGFSDVFKIRGWLNYTLIETGVLIAQKNRDHLEYYQGKAKKINVEIIINDDLNQTPEILSHLIGETEINQKDIKSWRFAYWTERNLLKYLNQCKKSNKDVDCFKNLEDYYFRISSGIFFTQKVIDRIEELYSAFQDHPRISAKCGNELIGNNFNDHCEALPSRIFKETYYQCKLNIIQVSTFIEHIARLGILKNSVDYLLYKEAGVEEKADDKYGGFFGWKISKLDFLPKSFRDSLYEISQDEYFPKYPVFWQWFIYVFGGFILEDIEEKEYELLAEKTGIPVENIPRAFEIYEKLFPVPNGWFMRLPNTKIRGMNMFPLAFRGIGANFRRYYYSKDSEFDDLNKLVTGLHSFNDLIKWNNLTVEILDRKFK